MEVRIQNLLDLQSDALKFRDKRVKTIRCEIGDTLDELSSQSLKELATIDELILTNESQIKKSHYIKRQREVLEQKLEGQLSDELELESKNLQEKINNIDEVIAKLQAERNIFARKLQEAESIISSRTAIYRDAIKDLDKQFSESGLDAVEEIYDILEKNKAKRDAISNEIEAARKGKILWDKVCNELQELDTGIKGLKRSQLPQISFLLTKASNNIENDLEVASQEGWSALVIAIGHELQTLHDALSAVQQNTWR